MGPAGFEFPITLALYEVWGYVPSVETMRSSLEYLAWEHSRLTDDLIKSRYEASMRPVAQEPYHATFGGANRQANIAMLASREEDIAALQHEMLVLHGRFDQVIPLESSVRLATLLPRADLNVFGECGHWVQIERMASFNRVVSEFFTKDRKSTRLNSSH